MVRANSEQRERPAGDLNYHIAKNMMTNDTLPYVVISADAHIETAQHYDFVASLNPPIGGVQRAIKAIYNIIRSV